LRTVRGRGAAAGRAAAAPRRYVREGVEKTVAGDGGGLTYRVRGTGALAEAMGEHEPAVVTLRRFDGDAFVAREKADDP